MKASILFLMLFFLQSETAVQSETAYNENLQKSIELFTNEFNNSTSSKPLVSYNDYKSLVNKVEKHREQRLIDLNTFHEMCLQEDVIILDARAEDLYKVSHIKGAINLPFTKFTQLELMRLIPSQSTKILIYCNNNIKNDEVNFASKVALPVNDKPIMLALNIPTYINLYGYGYKNVYELNDVIDVSYSAINTSYIQFEGTKHEQ